MPLKCIGQFLSDGRVEQDLVLSVFMGLHVRLHWFFRNSETYGGHFSVPIQSLAFKLFYMK